MKLKIVTFIAAPYAGILSGNLPVVPVQDIGLSRRYSYI